ncbi:MAG: hypothetical protein ABJG15_03210 [Hyphomonadaceae bacterium]
MKLSPIVLGVATLALTACQQSPTQQNTDATASAALAPLDASAMTFFLTSVGAGDGANLGGLEGADAHCTSLANAAGSTGRTWRAYLSTNGDNGVNAKDRIGEGPWVNARGETVATSIANLLDASGNNLSKTASITESGDIINGRGDRPNRHDILTGSDGAGLATEDTCGNWTLNGSGSATVGHHDRKGGGSDPTHWSTAHGSRGCSQKNLQGSGGDGLFYCFATD